MEKILIIEDDVDLQEGLLFAFASEGYRADKAATKAEGIAMLKTGIYDIAVLDCNLPDGSGFELCTKVREFTQLPILMLTARDTEMDEVKALELGVDDYMTKPFSLSVLKARIKNLLRRKEKNNRILSNHITVDKNTCKVYAEDAEIKVSSVEYKLLLYFIENKGKVLSKEQILNQIWDKDGNYVDDNTVSVNIRRLRMKIEKNPARPECIRTIHGIGYLWREV